MTLTIFVKDAVLIYNSFMPKFKKTKLKVELIDGKIIIPSIDLLVDIDEHNREFKIKKLEEAFALDCTVEEACLYAGVSKQSYDKLIEENPKLLKRFEMLRNYPVLKARQAVINAFDKNPKLALEYLERKRGVEFSLVKKDNPLANNNTIKIKLDFGNNKRLKNELSELNSVELGQDKKLIISDNAEIADTQLDKVNQNNIN